MKLLAFLGLLISGLAALIYWQGWIVGSIIFISLLIFVFWCRKEKKDLDIKVISRIVGLLIFIIFLIRILAMFISSLGWGISSLILICLVIFTYWCCKGKSDADIKIITGASIFGLLFSIIAQIHLLPALSIIDYGVKVSLQATFIAIMIGLTAAIIAFRNYRRKSGVNIQGSFLFPLDQPESQNKKINLLLLNLKDKSETVFSIYLQGKHGEYCCLYDFSETYPALILEPFKLLNIPISEHIQKNGIKVDKNIVDIKQSPMNKNKDNLDLYLHETLNFTFKIFLATSNGKYEIKHDVKYWNPKSENISLEHYPFYFQNWFK